MSILCPIQADDRTCTGMSRASNCLRTHPEREPGLCKYCGKDDVSKRYIHFIQKLSDSYNFVKFVSEKYQIGELDCICRKCEIRLKKFYNKSLIVDDDIPVAKKSCLDVHNQTQNNSTCFLSLFSECTSNGDHKSTIKKASFEIAFNISVEDVLPDCEENISVSICHSHYNKYNKFINSNINQCVVCEKNLR